MEPLTVHPNNFYDLMQTTTPQGDWPDPAQGSPNRSPHSPPSTAPNEGTLRQGDIGPVDPDPTSREPLRDEHVEPYAGQDHTGTGTQDSNEGIPDTPFWDSFLNTVCGTDPNYGEGGHHYSCDCSLCDATYRDMGHGGSHSLESHVAPTSQPSGEVRDSQFLDPPSPEIGLQDANDPPFPTVYLPTVQQPPSSADVLSLLKKCDGGKATCLWIHEGDECGFSSRVDLVKRHIKRVHFRLRPCVCQYCGRKFFNSYGLSLHYNSHTKAKPFICNFCGRGFSSPSGKSHHRVYMHGYRVPRRPNPIADNLPGAEHSGITGFVTAGGNVA